MSIQPGRAVPDFTSLSIIAPPSRRGGGEWR